MLLFQKDMKKMILRFNVKLMLSVTSPLSKLGGEKLFIRLMTTVKTRYKHVIGAVIS
jgi:hypothetical protein